MIGDRNHGKYCHFGPRRVLICEYFNGYKHGKSVLVFKYLNEAVYENYSYGQLDGDYRDVNPDGYKKCTYKDSRKHGVYTEYKNGKLVLSTEYLFDIKHGISYEYYDSGQIKVEIKYLQGSIISQIEYDINGKITYKWSNNARKWIDGTASSYYPNGKVMFKFEYECGYCVKKVKYDINGQVTYKKENSIATYYYPNGSVKCTGMVSIDNHKYGEWSYFSESGELEYTKVFYVNR